MKTAACLLALVTTAVSPALAGEPAQTDDNGAASVTARNGATAVAELCQMAQRGDADAQYQLAWVFAHGHGDERRDDWAADLFFAASSKGHAGATRMLQSVTWPTAAVPDCLAPVATAVVPAPAPAAVTAMAMAMAPPQIETLVRKLAPQYQVPAQLALAIIAVESNFDVAALSPKRAMGLMQLIPQTAQRFGVRDAFDVQQNVRGGLAYLRWLLAYFEGNVALVAAAYNAGEGAVERHRGVPPYDETRAYVRRVVARVGSSPQPFNARITAPSPRLHEMAALVLVD